MKKIRRVLKDPVCGIKINKNKAYARISYLKKEYYICCPLCQSSFEKEPSKYMLKI